MMSFHPGISLLVAALMLANPVVAAPQSAKGQRGLDRIGHIIVIYLENHSFDNLYGLFPGADGIAQASPENTLQVDQSGKIYEKLPPVPADRRFPENLPNKPFPIEKYVAADQKIGDLIHRFYQHQAQINGGEMNRFANISDAGGLTMGYYDGRKLPLWNYAMRFTLADHFFQAAFGGSFINHQWLACACTPRYEQAPDGLRARLNAKGELLKDGAVTPDGFVVNTIYPEQGPVPEQVDQKKLLPPLTQPTLGDRLSEKGVDWAWYSGGWDDAVAGRPDPSFQFHHQPYAYYKRYAANSDERRKHLKDLTDLLKGIEKCDLPPVVFYKPIGLLNEHPGYSDLLSGDQHIADMLAKLERSRLWKDSVVIITYDEYGGFWDHVAPPSFDRFGPGSRVPAIIVSPFAKKHYIDHNVYDTTSILKLIENRFGLAPLSDRDAKAASIEQALTLD